MPIVVTGLLRPLTGNSCDTYPNLVAAIPVAAANSNNPAVLVVMRRDPLAANGDEVPHTSSEMYFRGLPARFRRLAGGEYHPRRTPRVRQILAGPAAAPFARRIVFSYVARMARPFVRSLTGAKAIVSPG
ncbi:asparaginase domain-containing protein [Sinorhizobium saheli]|uniref:asparaginase domain-containing protein n=1 Tax=Sinorhizobium saheli TaxID=36856 RepID=UPI000A0627E8|nr:hypothetical protein [Sinorhizobium saheli]